MEKIENWENIEAKGISDFVGLKEGAYICKIINAEEHTNDITGTKSLKVQVDIADGEFKGYFQKQFDNDTNSDKKWNNNATRYLGLGESSQSFFKGFITVIEGSNNGYTWNWDEKTLKDKKVVGVFQPEEYEKQDGEIGVRIKLNSFRSIDKLNEVKVNNIKLLDGTYVDYNEYKINKSNVSNNNNDSVEIVVSDEDLPF